MQYRKNAVCKTTCEMFIFFFQAEDGIRDADVTGVQTCALPISEMLDEVRSLRSELERVRAEVQGHSLGALEGARRAKDEVKATKGRVKAQAKAAKSDRKSVV